VGTNRIATPWGPCLNWTVTQNTSSTKRWLNHTWQCNNSATGHWENRTVSAPDGCTTFRAAREEPGWLKTMGICKGWANFTITDHGVANVTIESQSTNNDSLPYWYRSHWGDGDHVATGWWTPWFYNYTEFKKRGRQSGALITENVTAHSVEWSQPRQFAAQSDPNLFYLPENNELIDFTKDGKPGKYISVKVKDLWNSNLRLSTKTVPRFTNHPNEAHNQKSDRVDYARVFHEYPSDSIGNSHGLNNNGGFISQAIG
jgi:hypothetical protein